MPDQAAQHLLAHDAGAIPWRLSVSPRARRISIRVSPRDGVRVTVPRRHDPREVERFVHSRRDWIAKHLGRFEALRAAAPPPTRPDAIELPAIGERWRVTYRETGARGVSVRERPMPPPAGGGPAQLALFAPAAAVVERSLEVSGPVGTLAAIHAALRRWLRQRAAAVLLPWLRELSLETDLPYTRVAVRGQRTRWGSCSAQGAISLNAKLLLVPREAARYVLVHELAHTRHLDHSARFWKLVARYAPDYISFRKVLRETGAGMPGWVEPPS